MNVVPALAVPADDGLGDPSTAEPATPPQPVGEGPHHLDPDVVDTPIKRDSSTMVPFTTLTRCRLDTLNMMGKEMKGYFVGPMPVEEFLQEFFPTSQIPYYDPSSFTSAFAPDKFSNVISAANEVAAYKPFVSIPPHIRS
jgi:hypothetical protein